MILKHYHNQEWTSFNELMPVDFKMRASLRDGHAGISSNFRKVLDMVASILPNQTPRFELGIGYLNELDNLMEND